MIHNVNTLIKSGIKTPDDFLMVGNGEKGEERTS